MSWSFAANVLPVAPDPAPVTSGGYRKILFRAPGTDGIVGAIDDGRLEVGVSLTVRVTDYATYETLRALFESGVAGDLYVPRGASDHWIYADAFVDGEVTWEHVNPDDGVNTPFWQGRVNFLCPNPRPTWESTGLAVF